MTKTKALVALWGVWAALVFAIVVAKDGLSRDNLTHLGIAVYFGLSLVAIPLMRSAARRVGRKAVYFAVSLASAAVVETCYMITAPLHPSLLIGAQTGGAQALRNLAVDLALTLPAYGVIFAIVWWLARRYAYGPFEYAFLVSLGQTAGDAQAFLVANPLMVLFLPYLMLNYVAMSAAPYAAVRDPGAEPLRRRGRWLLPLVLIPLAYGVCGTLILLVGRALGWIAK
jgi:hypothetical protein